MAQDWMRRRERRAALFQALLMSATLYSCASTSDDPVNGGSAGSGGHTSLAGSGGTNDVGGGTSLAGSDGTNDVAGGTNHAGAPSAPMAGSSGQGVGCSGTRPSCTTMTGGSCSDVFTAAECVNGAWQCSSGSLPPSQCQCIGAPMVCHPGKAGGACTADWVNASCSGGTWKCPTGTVNPGTCLCVLSGAEAEAGAGGEAATTCP